MKHILFDLKDCPFKLLDDARFVRNSLFHASLLSESEIIKIDFHKFHPQGVTAFAMLADSHISIHTWPEKGIAMCDIFTCGNGCKPELAVEYLSKWLSSTNTKSQYYERI